MGFWDKDNLLSMGESASGTLGAIPVVGEVMNASSAVYHAGSAVYDGVTGDRDGAINHGAQAIYSGVGAIPAVSEVLGTVDAVASGVGTVGRGVTAANGGDASQFPGGIGDLIGSTAVMLTNAVAGPDDSNWIAPGNTPTGTRGGEIGAGAGALGAAMSLLSSGGIPNPYAMYQGYQQGSQLGQQIAPHLGANNAGPTSGARGPNGQANGWAQSVGDEIHQAPGRAMRAMDRGIRDLYGNPGGF